jgi:hypothetical protein
LSNLPEFKRFDGIPRLFRECVITEKIDGTNAQVYVGEDSTVAAGSRAATIRELMGKDTATVTNEGMR